MDILAKADHTGVVLSAVSPQAACVFQKNFSRNWIRIDAAHWRQVVRFFEGERLVIAREQQLRAA